MDKILKYKEYKLLLEAEDEFDFGDEGLADEDAGGEDDLGDEGDEGDLGGEEGGDDFGGEEGEGPPEEDEEPEEVVHNDTPEEILKTVLKKIQKKVESMFEKSLDAKSDVKNDEVLSISDKKFSEKVGDKRTDKLNFEEMGMDLEKISINTYAKTNKNMTIKFSDDKHIYSLYIRIDLAEAIAKESDKEIEPKLVKKAYIKFKKINHNDFKEVGTVSRNIENVWEIGESEDFLINLKLEIDEEYDTGSTEELKIET